MRVVRARLLPAVFALAAFGASVTIQAGAVAASAEKGRAVYIQYGCWQCHDYNGQGSVATSGGKVIARTELPLDAFTTFVRTTTGQMPPYRAPVISDEELGDIYAYLQALPQPKPVSDIPLLGQVRAQ
jgi:mono/diheme cytochrome c family protein